MPTAYVHRVLYLGIRNLVSPLAISTTLPASSHLDCLGILLLLFHLASHREIIHTEGTLLCLVSSSRTTLTSERESYIVAAIDSFIEGTAAVTFLIRVVVIHW